MRLKLIFGIVYSFYAVTCASNFREENITQFLNPIDSFDQRTWENRYFIDDDSHVDGGPIFLYVGGLEPFDIEPRMNSSHFLEIGADLGAILVISEHRFFTEFSRPTPNVSLTSLQHLNIRATIADVANLITQLKTQYGDVPVIAHGNDQGGALAIWTRQQHPNLIDGVWSTSPALLGIHDMGEYLVHIGQTIRRLGGDECYNNMEQAFRNMASYYDRGYFSILEEEFNTCDSFIANSPQHEHTFYEQMLMGITAYFRSQHTDGVLSLCEFLSGVDDPMIGFANFRRERVTTNCLPIDIYRHLDPFLSDQWRPTVPGGGPVNSIREYMYLVCSAFGWWRTTTFANQPFGDRLPLEAFDYQCQLLFGASFTGVNIGQMIENQNRDFGGSRPNVTKVYITDGELDPFQVIGIAEPYGNEVYVDFIPNFAANAELAHSSTVTDDSVRQVQTRARGLIQRWISEARK